MTQLQDDQMTPRPGKARMVTIVVVLVLAFLFVPIVFAVFTSEVPFRLLFGWAFFLSRVAGEIEWHPSGITLGLVSFACVVMLSNYLILRQFADHLASHQFNPMIISKFVILMIISCVAGIGLVGTAHESLWITTRLSQAFVYRSAREVVYRADSRNHLKRIGLMIHDYSDKSKRLPFETPIQSNGKLANHSWITRLIPFMDNPNVTLDIDWDKNWLDSCHAKLFQKSLPDFLIHSSTNPELPKFDHRGYGMSHYAANRDLFDLPGQISFKSISDEVSSTMFVGEAFGNYRPWGDPLNVRDLRLGINQSPDGFGAPWINGAHLLMGDGVVRFVSDRIDPKILEAMATPRGGETVTEY